MRRIFFTIELIIFNTTVFPQSQTLYGPDLFRVIEEGQSGFNANLDNGRPLQS